MLVPVVGSNLNGLRILLIGIPSGDTPDVRLVRAACEYMNETITLVDDSDRRIIVRTVASPSGFDPAILESTLFPSAYSQLRQLVRGIDAVVPIFTDSPPDGGLKNHDPLFGLGRDAAGAPIFFRRRYLSTSNRSTTSGCARGHNM